ncbi:RNA-binding protein [Candidatus Woesearchaeota archaeon]|nr:RNA-binding protein [Candidatus Woesearchaeota archaeon]
MSEQQKCNSCSKNVANDNSSTAFKCPNCLKEVIVRCGECRENSSKYKCPNCGFVGPN